MNNERGIDVRIAICEDNRQDAEALEGLLAEQRDRFPEGLQIERFPSGEALIAAYQSGERFELILLDIYMAEMSGVDAARTLRLLDPEAQLAFLTTSPDFALEAIGLEALHYLVKPVTRQKLDELLRRFFKRSHVRSALWSSPSGAKRDVFRSSGSGRLPAGKKGSPSNWNGQGSSGSPVRSAWRRSNCGAKPNSHRRAR